MAPQPAPLSPPSRPGRSGPVRWRAWLAVASTAAVLGCGLLVTAVPAQAATPAPIALTSGQCPADIAQGEIDGCVTELQDLLNTHGAGIGVDGDFGPGTLTAVKNYQSAHGLSADGIVGPLTKSSLDTTGAVPAALALTSAQCPADIAEGEIDGCVTKLQDLLNTHGAGIGVDGDFGPGTLTAVKNYQSAHGLSADGIVGPNTKAALDAVSTSVPAPIALTSGQCPADIAQGEIDGCVTELQDLLNTHGAGIGVDGDFGPATFTAVETYQGNHGLSVDGIVGPDTKASLDGGTVTPPPPPSGSVLSKIVGYAQDIENGDAEPGWDGGWPGGAIQYVWGGGHESLPGPSTGTCVGDPQSLSCTDPGAIGLDCSGFARWVYDLAYGQDVLGSGSTENQIGEMTQVSSPVAGDLVFFGSSASNTEHVGVYIGDGEMINSYDTGTVVQTNAVSAGGNLIGYYQY
ncbi:peptidoglycan-binding protein [Streptacidiphilus sp. P02-A3a]|uniref:C40 family peptidase n=1 Tax=Streptacidiphilus sp. P02-A3a TaxID=2704468 RepID=UPI001CDD4669|nr:peptidoglycan-binding protein [Streptacidiphilus sp. P02-A3a]